MSTLLQHPGSPPFYTPHPPPAPHPLRLRCIRHQPCSTCLSFSSLLAASPLSPSRMHVCVYLTMDPLSSHCNAEPVTRRRFLTPLFGRHLACTHVHPNTCMLYQHTSMHTYSGIGARKHALAVHGSAGSARNNLMPRKAYSVCVCVSRGTPRQRTETRRGTKRNERKRKHHAQTQSACCGWTGEACLGFRV